MTELMHSLCNDCVARNQCGKDDVKMCISYTKEIKIKCDDCKFVEDCVDYGWEGCKKFTQKQPHTNEEWLRTATTEQLAEFVVKAMILYDNSTMTVLEAIKNAMKNDVKLSNYFMESLLEWLKQPHTNKE